jgi:hypothetical protein
VSGSVDCAVRVGGIRRRQLWNGTSVARGGMAMREYGGTWGTKMEDLSYSCAKALRSK